MRSVPEERGGSGAVQLVVDGDVGATIGLDSDQPRTAQCDRGGELIAIQDSSKGTTLQLTNVHGDVIATADPNPGTTKLLAAFRFDEFGNPASGEAGRFETRQWTVQACLLYQPRCAVRQRQ